MPHATQDLWPSTITSSTDLAPLTLMKEQAALLGKKTKNVVKGKVVVSPSMRYVVEPGTTGIVVWSDNQSEQQPRFSWDFFLVAPNLDDYQYRLFSVEPPNVLQDYPLTIYSEFFGSIPMKVKNEEEFIERLKEILGSDRTVRIVQALVAQS